MVCQCAPIPVFRAESAVVVRAEVGWPARLLEVFEVSRRVLADLRNLRYADVRMDPG